MAFVERRTFFGKVGGGHALIKHILEGNAAMARYGLDVKARVLSDYNSGRTDRVVVEWETEGPGQIDEAIGKVMDDPQGREEISAWLDKLNELVHYAEAEHWEIQ